MSGAVRLIIAACIAFILVGCAGDGMTDERALRGIESAESSLGTRPAGGVDRSDESPAMIVRGGAAGGRRIPWDELLPLLAESGGAVVIEELRLDAAIEAECRRRNIVVGPDEIEAERTRFAEAVSGDASGVETDRVVDTFRRDRGLGPLRYEAMLRRTAMLRALVRDQAVVTEGAVERAYRERYGPRYDIRVIVTRTARECEALLTRLEAGASFEEEAGAHSIDASAESGGLLRMVSAEDLAWPQALRSMLPAMGAGEIRGPVAMDTGWALVRMVRVRPPDPAAPPLESVREELAARTRLVQERILMEAESRRLASGWDVWVDPRLGWASESGLPEAP